MSAGGGAGRAPRPGQPERKAERLVFDDPLSRQTADDTDEGWGERREPARDDALEWYLRERPPHHGG